MELASARPLEELSPAELEELVGAGEAEAGPDAREAEARPA